MSSGDTRHLIGLALEHLGNVVPALKQLKLVVKLELRAHGGDTPIWRVEVPGPKIERYRGGDARLDVSIPRSHFNELAKDGSVRHWREAFESGTVKATGPVEILRLIQNVVERQEERGRTRKLRSK